MKPVAVLLLAICALAKEEQGLASRTFSFVLRHNDQHVGAVQASHSLNFQAHGGYHHHALPTQNSHGSYAHQAHGHGHHQGQGHVVPGQQHHSNHGHDHQHPHQQPSTPSGAGWPVAGNENMASAKVCCAIAAHTTAHTTAASPSPSGSLVPTNVLSNITTSIGSVAGKVLSPIVTLLHNASVWFNRTALSNHGQNVHQDNHSTASPAHMVHELLALKKHQPVPASSRTTTVATTMAPRPAVTVTSPPPPTAGTPPSSREATVSGPVQVLTSTVGNPAPSLGVTASWSHSSSTLPAASSADTPTLPEGRTDAIATTVPFATTATEVFTAQTASPSGTAVPTSTPTEVVSIRSGTVFTTSDAAASTDSGAIGHSAPTSRNATITALPSLPTAEVVSMRTDSFPSAVAVTKAATLAPVAEPVTTPVTILTPSATLSASVVHTSTTEIEDRFASVTLDAVSSTTGSPVASQATELFPHTFTVTTVTRPTVAVP